ncbi:ATP-dependent sacrificial sulfur transferase LarE [Marinitoga arctica]
METSLNLKIEQIKAEIKNIVKDNILYIAFSGGMDSTIAAFLAKEALGPEKVKLVNVLFGPFAYSKSIESVLKTADELGLEIEFADKHQAQYKIMMKGPNCNQCTKKLKMSGVRAVAGDNLVATGANQSDSWGKTCIKVMNNLYSPIIGLTKDELRMIVKKYNLNIRRVGENAHREGCKLKHLLKLLINMDYHGRAVSFANEIIHDILDRYEYKREIANVKIIGPLSKNIALINIKPYPPKEIYDEIVEILENEESIDEVYIVDKPLKLVVSANPGIYGNEESRYWIEKGRLQPEFAAPIKIIWKKSKNERLSTFHVVDFQFEE